MRLLRLRMQPWHSMHCHMAGACAKLDLTSILTLLPTPVPPNCPHPPQGGFENLTAIRQAGVQCPLLCKEFIVEVGGWGGAESDWLHAMVGGGRMQCGTGPTLFLRTSNSLGSAVGLVCNRGALARLFSPVEAIGHAVAVGWLYCRAPDLSLVSFGHPHRLVTPSKPRHLASASDTHTACHDPSLPPPRPPPQAYQVFKARASGADAILLIAAVLPNSDMNYLIKAARSVGLQCLIEVRRRRQLSTRAGAAPCRATL